MFGFAALEWLAPSSVSLSRFYLPGIRIGLASFLAIGGFRALYHLTTVEQQCVGRGMSFPTKQ